MPLREWGSSMKTISELATINPATINPATFGSVTYLTKEKFNKSELAQVGACVLEKMVVLDNCQLAYNYASAVNRHIDAVVGKDTDDYQAEKPRGKFWVNYPLILGADKNPETLYLRVYLAKNTKAKNVYFCDGQPATDEQIAKIKEIKASKPKTLCKKQADAGLENEDEQVIPRDITLANIIELRAFGEIWSGYKDVSEYIA